MEILGKLKEKSKPKIILLTVIRYTDNEKQKLFHMTNLVDYISKPFDLDDLVGRIQKQVLSLEKLNSASI